MPTSEGNGQPPTPNYSPSHTRKQRCRVCSKKIKVQIFRGTGYCSTNCEKEGKGIKNEERALTP